jgi:hypothetical protein
MGGGTFWQYSVVVVDILMNVIKNKNTGKFYDALSEREQLVICCCTASYCIIAHRPYYLLHRHHHAPDISIIITLLFINCRDD